VRHNILLELEPSRVALFTLEFPRPFADWLRALSFLGLLVFAHGICAAETVVGQHHGLGLDQLIALSIRNHPSIAAARAEVGAAQAEVGAARSQYYPTPSVQLLQDKGEPVLLGLVDRLIVLLPGGGVMDGPKDAVLDRLRQNKSPSPSAGDRIRNSPYP